MADQSYITDDAELAWMIAHPRTSDGEPMWSLSTVAEKLFDATPFEQMLGQTALETDGDD